MTKRKCVRVRVDTNLFELAKVEGELHDRTPTEQFVEWVLMGLAYERAQKVTGGHLD